MIFVDSPTTEGVDPWRFQTQFLHLSLVFFLFGLSNKSFASFAFSVAGLRSPCLFGSSILSFYLQQQYAHVGSCSYACSMSFQPSVWVQSVGSFSHRQPPTIFFVRQLRMSDKSLTLFGINSEHLRTLVSKVLSPLVKFISNQLERTRTRYDKCSISFGFAVCEIISALGDEDEA